MDANNKVFLDTNRHHLIGAKNGGFKSIDVPKFWAIMVKEFIPRYGTIDQTDFDQVAKLVIEVYQHYDAQLNNLVKQIA